MTKKTGLVISGGGSRGAYAAGAIKFMVNELNMKFDLVAGTSTGALIAPMMVFDDLEPYVKRLEETYTTVRRKDIVRPRFPLAIPFRNSILKTWPLKRLVRRSVSEEECDIILNSDKELFLTTVGLKSGKTTYFTNQDNVSVPKGKLMEVMKHRKDLMKAMVASSNVPIITSPIRIKKDQYIDGGMRDAAPLNVAIKNGVTDLVAILLFPAKVPVRKNYFNRIPEITLRTSEMIFNEIIQGDLNRAKSVNDTLHYLKTVKSNVMAETGLDQAQVDKLFSTTNNPFTRKRPLKVTIIRPDGPLPGGNDSLSFDPKDLRDMFNMGFKEAKKTFGG